MNSESTNFQKPKEDLMLERLGITASVNDGRLTFYTAYKVIPFNVEEVEELIKWLKKTLP